MRTLSRFQVDTLPGAFDRDAWVNATLSCVTAFAGSLAFDLGGRSVEVIETPGHSPGSVYLLDTREGLLFTGDSIMAGDILMQFENREMLSTFLGSVKRLVAISGRVTHVVPSHGESPLDPVVLLDLERGLERILSGEIRGVEYQSRFGPACSAGSGRVE